MNRVSIAQTRQWIKTSDHPMARLLKLHVKRLRRFELPLPQLLLRFCYALFVMLRDLLSTLLRIVCWTPLFKGRVEAVGKNLFLYGGLPYICGPLHILLGSNCRLSGQTSLTARTSASQAPRLMIGSNVDIGWMTTIAVGSIVELGDNVRIAGRALLAGYPGHPLAAEARALGLPETDDQVGAIILEHDVWLATGVFVMSGVTIGHGTIVAAGSVVTHDLPPMVLAGGVPAKVIRPLSGLMTDDKEEKYAS